MNKGACKEMELMQYWNMLKRRFLLIISVTLVAVLIIGSYSFFLQEKEYEASATLLIQSQKESDKIVYNDLMANQKLIKTYGEIIKSRQIAEDVVRKLPIKMTAEQALSQIRVTTANDSLITSITGTSTDPKVAVMLANGFAESFSKNLNSIMKVDNVSILDEAKESSTPTPVRPKPIMNMIIALIFGFFLGVGITILLEFLDNTIKSEEDVEKNLGLPVLGIIAQVNGEEGSRTKHAV
jgi:capsular polysaccharide biosynthesis protein